MKILQILDSPNWAIQKVAGPISKYNSHLHFRTLYIHPREVEQFVNQVRENLEWADIVDLQYWNTARQLLDLVPELKSKKLILSHHNQKDILGGDWTFIAHHVVHTVKAGQILAGAGIENFTVIPYGIDLNYFTYNDKYEATPKQITVGYCGRIVPWKGLKEVAAACYELNFRLLFMGKMDKPSYWAEIPEEHRNHIDLSFMEAGDDERLEFYRELTLFCQNSGDGREEGTLPLLEAMASGVPVVSTPAGIAADILHDKNAVITPFGDYEALKQNIEILAGDAEARERLRKEAWGAVKLLGTERFGWEYEKVLHNVFESQQPLISVIIPTFNSQENVIKILEALKASIYKHWEAVVCDDGSTDDTLTAVLNWRNANQDCIIKYINVDNILMEGLEKQKGYGLAKARNKGIIAAQGEYLMFCDSRLEPMPDAMSQFMGVMQDKLRVDKKAKLWLYGEKGGNKQTFVENFSFVKRNFCIRAGMFNERIDRYGGMSQEVRARINWQGFEQVYVPQACAKQLSGSHMTNERRADIIKSKLQLWKMGIK